jgi:hypothetical protein
MKKHKLVSDHNSFLYSALSKYFNRYFSDIDFTEYSCRRILNLNKVFEEELAQVVIEHINKEL